MLTVGEGILVVKVERIGRFTIAQVKDSRGINGTGISRCSFQDVFNEELGKEKAIGRAICALKRKENSEFIHNVFMG